MKDIRCGCGALLFRAAGGALRGVVEIKCRKCGTLNSLRPIEPLSERRERPSTGEDACGFRPRR
ncbi:Com family DNA-binding transcriptional regulator [Starkeya nomas]|uniref:Com family DNA-binding transcriptional regulator n=1 Tax=Starkeya nomas TaxID=2666134 RepID=UPI0013584A9C